MQQYSQIFAGRVRGFTAALDRLLNRLTNAQILWIVFALALLCALLLALLAARGRRHRRALDAMDRQSDEMLKIQQQANERIEDARRELQYKANILQSRSADFEELQRFYNEYRAVADAKIEARRMIAEARDYAEDVKGRAEREYTEVMMHAQTEAKAIREMAEAILARSHETLKHALERSERIIGESETRESARPGAIQQMQRGRTPRVQPPAPPLTLSDDAPDDGVGSLE